MVTNEAILPKSADALTDENKLFHPKITVFHCFNAIANPYGTENAVCDVKTIKMPCSSMTRDVFLLRAFESGADAVVVVVCPEGTCRHLEGNIRAAKRVARVKKLLDEIGLGGDRLNIFNIPHEENLAVEHIIKQTISGLETLGPNPAA
jgi:F420-non-reducing hydrogenase iron-sulfur subunit